MKVIKCYYLIVFIFINTILLGQTEIRIEYFRDTTNHEFTKKFISSHEFFLIIGEDELLIEKQSETVMYGPKLSANQISMIDTLSMVHVKIVNQKNCYYATLPNVFVKDVDYLKIDFYRIRSAYYIKGRFLWLWYTKEIAMNYTMPEGRSLRTGSLRLQNCASSETNSIKTVRISVYD